MNWKIDPAHSEINFIVRHMMISNVRGRFETFTGAVDFDIENPERSTVDVQIETASVNTRDEQRDTHLRSPDFFNASEYPHMLFKSKRVEVIDDSHGRIIGDLTIRQITKEVVLEATYNGMATSPYGQTAAGFSAATEIDRNDWDLQWNVALETGGFLVGDTIRIDLEIEIIQQSEKNSETG